MPVVRYVNRMKSASWFHGRGWYYQVAGTTWAGPYISVAAAEFAAYLQQLEEK